MQYSKYSNSEGITRDETSSAQSVCANQLNDIFGQTDVTFYLKAAVISIPCIVTVIITIVLHVCYKKIERKFMTFPKPDFYALVFVGIIVTVFIFTLDIISYVKYKRGEYAFENSFSLQLTFIVPIAEATVGSILIICLFVLIVQSLFQCCQYCQCCEIQWNRVFFQLLITPLSFVSFHTGYIFAAWVTEPSKTTSVAVLSIVVMVFIFIMFRFLYIFFECLIKKCLNFCKKHCNCCEGVLKSCKERKFCKRFLKFCKERKFCKRFLKFCKERKFCKRFLKFCKERKFCKRFLKFCKENIFCKKFLEFCKKHCKSCEKKKRNYKKVMNPVSILLNIVCTSVVATIGVGLIGVVLASFYVLPLPTIGLVEHLQNIVNICIVLLTALVTYKLIGANESDTEKFLRILNKSYMERKMMTNLTKAEALNNYDTISANFKICLQLNKIEIMEHGNKKRAIIECDSSNCIIHDPQNDFDIDVPIDSAKLYTDSFFANEDTFETDFTKCVFEVRVLAALGSQICRFPVPSDSTLNSDDIASHDSVLHLDDANSTLNLASKNIICLKELYKTQSSQYISISQITINDATVNKSCQLSFNISISKITSSDHLLRSSVWCPLDGSVIAITKEEGGEITRELIPKKFSCHIKEDLEKEFNLKERLKEKGFVIKQGRLLIYSKLTKKVKISSLGSKVRINLEIPCNKGLEICEGSRGGTILLSHLKDDPQSETPGAHQESRSDISSAHQSETQGELQESRSDILSAHQSETQGELQESRSDILSAHQSETQGELQESRSDISSAHQSETQGELQEGRSDISSAHQSETQGELQESRSDISSAHQSETQGELQESRSDISSAHQSETQGELQESRSDISSAHQSETQGELQESRSDISSAHQSETQSEHRLLIQSETTKDETTTLPIDFKNYMTTLFLKITESCSEGTIEVESSEAITGENNDEGANQGSSEAIRGENNDEGANQGSSEAIRGENNDEGANQGSSEAIRGENNDEGANQGSSEAIRGENNDEGANQGSSGAIRGENNDEGANQGSSEAIRGENNDEGANQGSSEAIRGDNNDEGANQGSSEAIRGENKDEGANQGSSEAIRGENNDEGANQGSSEAIRGENNDEGANQGSSEAIRGENSDEGANQGSSEAIRGENNDEGANQRSNDAITQGGNSGGEANQRSCMLSTAKNDKIMITLKSDHLMSLFGLYSSIPSINLNKRKVKVKMNSVSGVLHYSRDIDVVEIEKVKNQWKITFDNVIVSNLKGCELEIFSLTTMEKSSLFLGFPSYECDIIGDDIETAATICGNLLSKV